MTPNGAESGFYNPTFNVFVVRQLDTLCFSIVGSLKVVVIVFSTNFIILKCYILYDNLIIQL